MPTPTPNPVSSALVPPVPTPKWGPQSAKLGAFTVRAKSTINAPVNVVLDTLLDTTTWPRWNNFVPSVSIEGDDEKREGPDLDGRGRLRPGAIFTEHVDMSGRGKASRDMKLVMTTLTEREGGGRLVVWVGKEYPDWALRSERVHEVYAEGDATVYDVYETFSGVLAVVVKFFVGMKLAERFGQWNAELGARAEGLHAGEVSERERRKSGE